MSSNNFRLLPLALAVSLISACNLGADSGTDNVSRADSDGTVVRPDVSQDSLISDGSRAVEVVQQDQVDALIDNNEDATLPVETQGVDEIVGIDQPIQEMPGQVVEVIEAVDGDSSNSMVENVIVALPESDPVQSNSDSTNDPVTDSVVNNLEQIPEFIEEIVSTELPGANNTATVIDPIDINLNQVVVSLPVVEAVVEIDSEITGLNSDSNVNDSNVVVAANDTNLEIVTVVTDSGSSSNPGIIIDVETPAEVTLDTGANEPTTPVQQPVDTVPVGTTPVEPTPVEPAPVEPTPVEPTPVEPTPVEPTPVEPAPVEPAPVEPTPVEPTPVEPAPVEPAPVEPAPVEPTPVEPTVETTPVKLTQVNYDFEYFIKEDEALNSINLFAVSSIKGDKLPYQQDSSTQGVVSIESENFHSSVARGNHYWDSSLEVAGFSGVRAMKARRNLGVTYATNFQAVSPQMDYEVKFAKTGIHYVWVRGLAASSGDDSLHIGLNNIVDTSDNITGFNLATKSWTWVNGTMDKAVATINVTSVGIQTLQVWMREDSVVVDKIIVTSDPSYVPEGFGPAESAKAKLVTAIETNGNVLNVANFTQGINGGKVEQGADGLFNYIPAENYFGKDEFTITYTDGTTTESVAKITVWIDGVNDLLAIDDELVVKEDQTLAGINVLANDKDAEGDNLTLVSYTQGVNGGVVSLAENGLLTYVPTMNFNGVDEFSYVVRDGKGGEATAKAVVLVQGVNDIPVASADSFVVKQSQSSLLMLLSNDKGLGDGVNLSLVSTTTNGVVTINSDGSVNYLPKTGYFGKDEFVYKISDADGDTSLATVALTIECVSNCTQTFSLSWNPSVSSKVSGYKLHIGTESGKYTDVLTIGNVTKYDHIVNQKGNYFFAVSTLTSEGKESVLSTQVSASF